MEKRIGMTQVRQELAHIVDDVKYRGGDYLIVRYGEPAAAIVPVDVYRRWQRERESLTTALRDLTGSDDPTTDSDELVGDLLAALRMVRASSPSPEP